MSVDPIVAVATEYLVADLEGRCPGESLQGVDHDLRHCGHGRIAEKMTVIGDPGVSVEWETLKMKRYDRSVSDFYEQTRLQLQHVVPEQRRAFGSPLRAGRSSGTADRLFAIRALLDQAADPRGQNSNVTRH